jgi:hypothetical protein
MSVLSEKWEWYWYEGDNGEEVYDLAGIRTTESHMHVTGGFNAHNKEEISIMEHIVHLHNRTLMP